MANDLLNDYDVIGFDPVTLLTKFHAAPMQELVLKTHLGELNAQFPKKYPNNILLFDLARLPPITSAMVWCLKTGYMVQLGPSGEVMRAFSGLEQLKDV